MPRIFSDLSPFYIRHGLKVGTACVLSYTLAYCVGSVYAAWAVVSSIIAMQANVAESLHIGLLRVSGTIIGAAAGVAGLLLFPQNPVFMGVAILAITGVCGMLSRYGARFSLASIAACIVLLTGASFSASEPQSGFHEALNFGLLRVADIAIGVGSAFTVSFLVWPVRLMDTLRMDISLQYREAARLLDALVGSLLRQEFLTSCAVEDLERRVLGNRERLAKAIKHEAVIYHYSHEVLQVQVTTLERAVETLRTLWETLSDYEEEGELLRMSNQLRCLADFLILGLQHMGSEHPGTPVPDIVRGLAVSVEQAEFRLAEQCSCGQTRSCHLHKLLQVFTFYQAMRQLAESLLLAFDQLDR